MGGRLCCYTAPICPTSPHAGDHDAAAWLSGTLKTLARSAAHSHSQTPCSQKEGTGWASHHRVPAGPREDRGRYQHPPLSLPMVPAVPNCRWGACAGRTPGPKRDIRDMRGTGRATLTGGLHLRSGGGGGGGGKGIAKVPFKGNVKFG
ncbi:unnamed protein product [Boreogadus saida]